MERIERRENKEFYILIFPWIIVFISMTLIPLLYGLYLSFSNYSGFNFHFVKLVGFRNYHNVFTDSRSMSALGHTFFFTSFNLLFTVVFGFFLSLLLNNSFKGNGIIRSLYYLPAILPVTAVGLMWKNIFANNGIMNDLLHFFGISAINWLDPDHNTYAMLILLCWGSGVTTLIYLAGLKGIPEDLYEAASIDGAHLLQKFRLITMPLMTPVIFFNIILGMIGSMQLFLQPLILTPGNGGFVTVPQGNLYLYYNHVYLEIFALQRYAYGLALLWTLIVISLVITIILFGTSRFWVYTESDNGKGR
jgi:multiple sugar transport system permease protein